MIQEDDERRALSARMSRYSRPSSAMRPTTAHSTQENRDHLMRSAKKLIPASALVRSKAGSSVKAL